MTDPRSPYLVVRLDGTPLKESTARQAMRLRITFNESKADTGEIAFRDPDFALFDSRMFAKGRELSFIMGWADSPEPRGPYVIKKYKTEAPASGNPTLIVSFQDRSHVLNRKQRQRRFVDQKASGVVKRIAEANGMGFDIEEPGSGFSEDLPLMQANITDARLLQNLSDRYGYVWGIEGNTIYFRRPIELENIGQQSHVVTLSYRINDKSLRSFQPEIKFLSNRKRTGAAQKSSNIDLLDAVDRAGEAVSEAAEGTALEGVTEAALGIFDNETVRETIGDASKKLEEATKPKSGEDTDDDEAQGSTDSTSTSSEQRQERADRNWRLDSDEELVHYETDTEAANNANEESEPGDSSGAATPDTPEEAALRNAGKSTKASEVVEGPAHPTTASMHWRAGDAVVLAGIGERLSGRYRVASIEQSITVGETFRTMLQVKRRGFRPSAEDKELIAAATEEANKPDEEKAPIQSNPIREKVWTLDANEKLASSSKRIDGQEST